jgi:predicted HD superfamily hydrolase involved in NAD metabolism
VALTLPPTLAQRLAGLPAGLAAHVERVRGIARELAAAHGLDPDTADLAAAAHDVARHIPGPQLLAEAARLGIRPNAVERAVPVLLHGPVGAGWLAAEGSLGAGDALEGVRWHTTAHPDLAPLGQVLFIADKLDPHKARAYPFQGKVREAAARSLDDGVRVFLDGALRQHVDRGELVHPLVSETRNALLLAARC